MMSQKESSNSSSVAWFKLAYLIAKKEKEKALNVFRVLTHSLRDRAYALQVEGDILSSLNDDIQAQDRYTNAAFLYRKDKRWVHAVAIYENLLQIDSKNYATLSAIILCYGQLGWKNKFQEKLDNICNLLKQNNFDEREFSIVTRQLADVAKELENEDFKKQIYDNIQNLIST